MVDSIRPIVLTSGGLENQLLVGYLQNQNHSVDRSGVFVMGVEGRHVEVIPYGAGFRFKRSDEIDKEDPLWEVVNEQSVGGALTLLRKPGQYLMASLDYNKKKNRGYDPNNPQSFSLRMGTQTPNRGTRLLIYAPDYDVNRQELFEEMVTYYQHLKFASDEQVRAITLRGL